MENCMRFANLSQMTIGDVQKLLFTVTTGKALLLLRKPKQFKII
jgi:hypothetical protein